MMRSTSCILIFLFAATIALADGGPKADFDKDHMLRIDGKRVFPVALCSGAFVKDDDLREIAAAGFNTVLPSWTEFGRGPEAVEHDFDILHEGGVFIIPEASSNEVAAFRQRVLAYRDHPAVIGWHVMDEPTDRYRADGARVYDPGICKAIQTLAKELVPNDFLTMADYRHDVSFAGFWEYADVAIVDEYTVGRQDLAPQHVYAVKRQVESTIRLVDNTRSVWFYCQTHNIPGGGATDRAPTADEIRAFCYTAICSGAKGIVFFEHYWSRRNETWPAVKQVAGELAILQPVLTDPSEPIALSGPVGMDIWSKMHEGKLYVIAVNREFEAKDPDMWVMASRRVTIELPIAVKAANVLFESRQAELEGIHLKDLFEARQAHVYELQLAKR